MQRIPKYIDIRDTLLKDVRRGKYEETGRMPAERELAKRFAVSHMTVRKAVSELVESGFVERRSRDGIYLTSNAVMRLQKKTLQLVCTAYEAPVVRDFLRAGQEQAEVGGWNSHVVRINQDQGNLVVRAIETGDPCVILAYDDMSNAVVKAMQEHAETVVLVGADLSMLGISSVCCDDMQVILQVIDLLKRNGHEKVALVAHDISRPAEKAIISAWQSSFNKDIEAPDQRLIIVSPPVFECCTAYTCGVVKEHLAAQGHDATAFICMLDEATIGAMSACRQSGLRVPEDVSFVNLRDSASVAFAHPRITSVDLNISGQIQSAIEILKSGTVGAMQTVSPELIERESVQDLNDPAIAGKAKK